MLVVHSFAEASKWNERIKFKTAIPVSESNYTGEGEGEGGVGIFDFADLASFQVGFSNFASSSVWEVIFDIVILCGFSVFIVFLFGCLILMDPKALLYTDSKLANCHQNVINEANYFIIHFYCKFSPLNSVHGSHDLI